MRNINSTLHPVVGHRCLKILCIQYMDFIASDILKIVYSILVVVNVPICIGLIRNYNSLNL